MGLPRLVMITGFFVLATFSTTARQVALNFETVKDSIARPFINDYGQITIVKLTLFSLLVNHSVPDLAP
jgi:hypothetical protein